MKNKKTPRIFSELVIWARGRLSMTSEEKVWLLILLFIIWTGITARYVYLNAQPAPQPLTQEQVKQLLTP